MPETCLSLRHCLSNSSKDAASLVNSSNTSFCIKPAALDVARGSHSRPSPSPAWPTVSNAFPLVVIMSKKCKVSAAVLLRADRQAHVHDGSFRRC